MIEDNELQDAENLVVARGTGGKLDETTDTEIVDVASEMVGDEADEGGEIELGDGAHIVETDESGFAEEVEDVEVTEPELDEDTATNDDEEEDA